MQTIAIVDFSFGNLRSVHNALLGMVGPRTRIVIADRPEQILEADRVIFPGQGAARHCMLGLRRKNLIDAILQVAQDRPFLGICMGMQVLMEHSEENGGTLGLELIHGTVQPFARVLLRSDGLKIPHMGWNTIHQQQPHPLWENIPDQSRFYFVHSYYVEPDYAETVAGHTLYPAPFASAIAQDFIFAMQCHPEKSGQPGLTLLRNFLRWDGQL